MSVSCGVENPKSILRKPEPKAAEPAKETKPTEAKKATTTKSTKK